MFVNKCTVFKNHNCRLGFCACTFLVVKVPVDCTCTGSLLQCSPELTNDNLDPQKSMKMKDALRSSGRIQSFCSWVDELLCAMFLNGFNFSL